MPGIVATGHCEDAGPIGAETFFRSMAAFEPFEPAPVMAAAVSGGPDSMALILLLDEWARARGGSAVAVTIDHGLRPDSAAEAHRVGIWLGARGVAHSVVRWRGEKPETGVQNAARAARYRLLAGFCEERGILHLAVGHHADDQAETVLFRRERGSGADGLAGMAASRSLGAVRLIRPLLGWPKAALIATCALRGQASFDDPSNGAPRFARTTLRRRLASDPALKREALAEAAAMGSRRALSQKKRDEVLARVAEIRPDGVALLDRAALSAAPPEERDGALSATLRMVGGNAFAPAVEAVARLGRALTSAEFAGASLGGCVIRVWCGTALICRESRGVAPPVELVDGEWRVWDGRFEARIGSGSGGVTLGALGRADYAALRRRRATFSPSAALPSIAGASLPAARRSGELLAVPAIGWAMEGAPALELRLTPRWPLSSETFTVVNRVRDIIFDVGE
jgi:tRNA(Ile)-lysidine synthase